MIKTRIGPSHNDELPPEGDGRTAHGDIHREAAALNHTAARGSDAAARRTRPRSNQQQTPAAFTARNQMPAGE